jgi:hypothetical protein
MERPEYIPTDYNRIQVVHSLSDLFNAHFNPANLILFPRELEGDFDGLARSLVKAWRRVSGTPKDVHLFDAGTVETLGGMEDLSPVQELALEHIMRDMYEVRPLANVKPQLRVVMPGGYEGVSATAYRFHADRGRRSSGRVLSCYNDPVTEGIRNEDAIEFDSGDRLEREIFFTLAPGAAVFQLHNGDIWRQAYLVNDENVPPFIHRAPLAEPDGPPRLILTAG